MWPPVLKCAPLPHGKNTGWMIYVGNLQPVLNLLWFPGWCSEKNTTPIVWISAGLHMRPVCVSMPPLLVSGLLPQITTLSSLYRWLVPQIPQWIRPSNDFLSLFLSPSPGQSFGKVGIFLIYNQDSLGCIWEILVSLASNQYVIQVYLYFCKVPPSSRFVAVTRLYNLCICRSELPH